MQRTSYKYSNPIKHHAKVEQQQYQWYLEKVPSNIHNPDIDNQDTGRNNEENVFF